MDDRLSWNNVNKLMYKVNVWSAEKMKKKKEDQHTQNNIYMVKRKDHQAYDILYCMMDKKLLCKTKLHTNSLQ